MLIYNYEYLWSFGTGRSDKRGLFPEKDCSTLLEAWDFPTEIESKIRIAQGRSLDVLMDDKAQLEALAKRLVYCFPGSSLSGEVLRKI
jgi:hypothetical protein